MKEWKSLAVGQGEFDIALFLLAHKEGLLMFIESAFMDTTIKDAVVSADMTSCVALTFDLSTGKATKIRQQRVSSESLVMTAGDDDECNNKAGEFSFF